MKKGFLAFMLFVIFVCGIAVLPNHEVYGAAKKSFDTLLKENEALKKENKALKSKVTQLSSSNSSLSKSVKTLESQKSSLTKKVKSLESQNVSLTKSVKTLEDKVKGQDKQVKDLQAQVKALQNEVMTLKNQLEQNPTDDTVPKPGVTGLVYKGKMDVVEPRYSDKPVENLHHYEFSIGEGYTFPIYVTEDYIKKMGEGFAYDEIGPMVDSIVAKRGVKPYLDQKSSLKFYFYTNESGTPFPRDAQAFAAYDMNRNNGIDTAIFMNASNMRYDFRANFHHEIMHYFDFNTITGNYGNQEIYKKYWGQNYRFWMWEGGAEFGSYYFYQYPKNTKNKYSLRMPANSKDSIIQYAKEQGSGKKNVLYDVELNSFDDIYKASGNNYGVTLSLFWYLEKQYGYNHIYDYIKYVTETFKDKPTISQAEKDQTAIKFFKKTEEQVLKEWLTYFNYFGGELGTYVQVKTGTVNHILYMKDPLLPEWVKNDLNEEPGFNLFINIKEWNEGYNFQQMNSFMENVTTEFKLTASGYPEVRARYTGQNLCDSFLENGERLNAFRIVVAPEEQAKMVSGVEYSLVPINNNPDYPWIISDAMKVVLP